jgi:hypothetical protein
MPLNCNSRQFKAHKLSNCSSLPPLVTRTVIMDGNHHMCLSCDILPKLPHFKDSKFRNSTGHVIGCYRMETEKIRGATKKRGCCHPLCQLGWLGHLLTEGPPPNRGVVWLARKRIGGGATPVVIFLSYIPHLFGL